MSVGLHAVEDAFEIGFVGSDGAQVRCSLADAVAVRFERVPPIRSIPSYQGQRHNPGLYWSATVSAHVEYESWLERDEALALDFDPDVVGIAAQPFWLFWRDGQRSRSHAPDFFARRADGTGVVTDCRPAARIKLRDEVAFAATARACASMGWVYRRVSEHDRVWLANVQWLAGYRHPRHRVESTAATLVAAFAKPQPLIGGARSAGDPVAVLPVLHHLLWSKELMVDLSQRLESMSIVSVAAAR
ncbi:TnsA-like heteromeric transposase endonuclease subunit [Rhodococcus sp. ARC_M8]|uniref:TnsA-like heteromeric transposase endonuclease subunit n=1 Tax=Rhodococcus qingshengii JCM 15477 TaxID=1303681 RepID=A0AB38RPV7_RHOSG|nr:MULTISPECIES: TnsA-like heteromeric transposase endonuclease subunit [Rhodococcus]MCJ0948945.1 TnsA-like heteromeric transposase endonuclease subunit [Rhodococcus sp. ARC_M8]ULD45014.1 TnsA-like heteromeric transposase endonuclease subunit [Rhodococcus qingshengii]UPU47119.1 TnsA-like heteromeric transposase endonuclease subunit [Rhodococcus qingshengii JCM 15477]